MTADRLHQALKTSLPGCAWLLRFGDDGIAHPGTLGDLAISAPTVDHGFIWLHLDLSDARVAAFLSTHPIIKSDIRQEFLSAIDHQFVERSGDVVFGALVDHQTTISGRTYDTDFLRFTFGANFILTARRHPLQGAEATRLQLSAENTADSPLALFEMIVTNICDCVDKMNREIAGQLDHIEDNVIVEGQGREQQAALGPCRRNAVRLARRIGGLCSTLLRFEETCVNPMQQKQFEVAARLVQHADAIARDIANLQDRARLLQEEVNGILTLETNDRLFTLTIITTLILPATFVTGFFGMNTKQLFFSEDDNGTIYATILCFAASCLALVILKKFGLTDGTRGVR